MKSLEKCPICESDEWRKAEGFKFGFACKGCGSLRGGSDVTFVDPANEAWRKDEVMRVKAAMEKV